MAYEIVIPRLGWSMEEGTFVSWLKKDGDKVQRGEAIFELEGEKAIQEIEAVDEGILRIPSTGPTKGCIVKVGAVIGYLVADVHRANSVPRMKNRAAFASPRARRVASELGIDWTGLSGTGAGGRIRERDVRAAASL